MSMVDPPDVELVRGWCRVSPDSIDDVQLGHVLGSEVELQSEQCDILEDTSGQGLIPEWAYQSRLRRCARQLAARGVPLGMLEGGEYGPARLASFDAEISRIEGPYRKMEAG